MEHAVLRRVALHFAHHRTIGSENPVTDKFKHAYPPSAGHLRVTVDETGTPHPELSPPLWHYTTFDAFESITRTQVLWASKIQFLNDEKEFTHAAEIVGNAVSNRLHTMGRSHTSEDVASVQSVFSQAQITNKCVVCFSQSRDQLSQWRGYSLGAPAPALAIGFDPVKLAEVAAGLSHGWKIEQCIYHLADQEAAAAPIVEAILSEWPGQDVRTDARRECIRNAVFRKWDEYLHLAPRLKHEGFQEEREVRLVSMPVSDNKLWRFRRSPTLIVPYVEFPLTHAGATLDSLIREIVVGPNPHSKVIAVAVGQMCHSRGIRAAVRGSNIPYR
jgi:hypothetical protein